MSLFMALGTPLAYFFSARGGLRARKNLHIKDVEVVGRVTGLSPRRLGEGVPQIPFYKQPMLFTVKVILLPQNNVEDF